MKYIYSKYKDIYVLSKILNILNISNIYQIEGNSIIIKAEKEQIYEYSTNDYNLIKFKKYELGELTKLNDNLIISYKNRFGFYRNPIKSNIDLIDAKTYNNLWTIETDNIITSMKMVNNELLLIGRKGGLYKFTIIKNNIVIEDKLFDLDDNLLIENINIIDKETISLLLCSVSKKYITFLKKSK